MSDVVSCRPAVLAQSLVLSRLATGPPLLPSTIASLISALSIAARISIRSAGLFIEQILESIRLGTIVGMGLTRRALIAAVGSARTMHYVARGLDFSGKDQYGNSTSAGGLYLSVLDHYTNMGVYVITHVFTLAELFSMAGLSLTTSVTSLGFTAAEESVRIVDGLLGSGESSRALSSIISLVRKELADDPAFHSISSQGVIATFSALTKALTCFVCLQAATTKRTAKEMKMRVVYDCTVVEEGQGTLRDDEEEAVPDKRHSRAPSSDLLVANLRDEYDAQGGLSPRLGRSRQTSVNANGEEMEQEDVDEQEQTEIVRELTELCGGEDGSEDEEELPVEVKQALRDLQDGREGKRLVSCSLGTQYEIVISETTTTTTTVVRTTDSRTSASSAHELDGPTPRTISRRSRTRPTSILPLTELGDETMDEDDWIELGTGSSGQGDGQDDDGREAIPSEGNGQRSLAARARQDTLGNPEESQQRLQVVLRTMTQEITKRTRTLRRVGTASGSATPTPETTPKAHKREAQWSHSSIDAVDSPPPSTSPAREKSKGVFRALKALKKSNTVDASSFLPGRSSRGRSLPTSRDKSPPRTPDSLADLSPPSSPELSPSTPLAFKPHSRQDSSSSTISEFHVHNRRPSHAPEPLSTMTPTPATTSAVLPHLRHASSFQSMRSSFITTCKHTAATPMEEPEPKVSNFPKRHTVENLQRFMRYSSAAYGQAFMRILRLGASRGGDFTFPNTRSPANNHAFAHHVGIKVDDILLDTYTDNGVGIFDNEKISPVIAYVAVDHEAAAIVLSCRGSLGLSDILVDLICDYETIHVPDGDPMEHYYVHSGMWHSACKMQRGTVHDTIRHALVQYPQYGLVICGHSLGGGVAALLSILWACPVSTFERDLPAAPYWDQAHHHPPLLTPFVTSFASGLPAGRPISCFAYGPPCVASVDLQRYCRGLVTSTVANNDIVPTLSLGTLRDLKTMAMNLHEEGNGTTQEVIGRVVGLWQEKVRADKMKGAETAPRSLYDVSEEARMVAMSTAEIAAGRGSNKALDPAYTDPFLSQPELSEELVVNDYLWSVMRTLRASNVNDKLYPPGDNLVVESYTVFISSESSSGQYSRREGSRILLRACDDVEKRFGEPIFGKSLFLDHSPSTLEANLDLLAKAVLG